MADEMMDRVIRKLGFEDKRTINFCRLCEWGASMTMLKEYYEKIMREAC